MKFEVPGQPQGKGRAKVTIRGQFAHAYTPEKTVNYENLIKLCFQKVAINSEETIYCKPLTMRIIAQYSVPKSFSQKKSNAALIGLLRPQTKPDCDNVIKVVCDALNKIAYYDDSQIVEIYATKRYAREPKLIVEIEEFKD